MAENQVLKDQSVKQKDEQELSLKEEELLRAELTVQAANEVKS